MPPRWDLILSCWLAQWRRVLSLSAQPPSTQAPHRFLLELERRMEENIVISDVCDIVYRYAANHFSVYITYVSNQTYQERTYKQLL